MTSGGCGQRNRLGSGEETHDLDDAVLCIACSWCQVYGQ